MSTSPVTFIFSVAALAIYGYSVYYMNFNPNLKKMHELIPPPLRVYGQMKFLTYQCLLCQTVSAFLHVAAFFSKAFIKPRDIFFTAIAIPVGSVVVYTFWTVWHLLGRDLIFPTELSQFYPDWLNHVTHTIVVPFNFLFSYLVQHKFIKNGAVFSISYFFSYVMLLHYIRVTTGISVYKYLDTMNDTERYVYYLGTGLFVYIMYKTGQMLCHFLHHSSSTESASSRGKSHKKGQKQK